LPEELEEADTHLMAVLYSALEARQWERAKMVGAFAFDQKRFASDVNRRTLTVNYVQALKRTKHEDEARKILSGIDWTAAANEYKLADVVLREQWDDAAALMLEIGSSHKMLTEHAYHVWPLFIEFRETTQFADAYKQLFGHTYTEKLEEEVQATSADAAREAAKQSDSDTQINEEIAADERTDDSRALPMVSSGLLETSSDSGSNPATITDPAS
jgi:hypothetical protein